MSDGSTFKSCFRGEVVPIVVKVAYSLGDDFEVIVDGINRTFCEVRSINGEMITKLVPLRVIEVGDNEKWVMCSWDTKDVIVGYYKLKMWISINFDGEYEGSILRENFKMTSNEMIKYVKVEG
jgi:hypothetical protein